MQTTAFTRPPQPERTRMGIENREYMREEGSGLGWAWDGVRTLVALNCICYALQLIVTDFDLIKWFSLDVTSIRHGQVWRLISYQFLHDPDSFTHIFFNMWMLFLTGRQVEDRYGKREFLTVYLISGVIAGLCFCLFQWLVKQPGNAIGASGAVSAMVMLFVLNNPRQTLYLFGLVRIPAYVLIIFAIISDLYPLLKDLRGRGLSDHIAHSAHLGGMFFAFIYWQRRWFLSGWMPSMHWQSRLSRKPQLRVYNEPLEPRSANRPRPMTMESPPLTIAETTLEFNSRVDRVLQKIHESGEASLSEEDRAILLEASRRYKNRT